MCRIRADDARQHRTRQPGSSFYGGHPLAVLPRRLMSHVLTVATAEIRDPVILRIRVSLLLHRPMTVLR